MSVLPSPGRVFSPSRSRPSSLLIHLPVDSAVLATISAGDLPREAYGGPGSRRDDRGNEKEAVQLAMSMQVPLVATICTGHLPAGGLWGPLV